MAKYPKFYPAPLPPSPPSPPARQPCSTARRLALLRKLCAGAQDNTTRRMVMRVVRAWWGNGAADGADVKLGR